MNMLIESKPLLNQKTKLNSEPIIPLQDVSVAYRVPKERIGTFKEYAIRTLQRKVQFNKFLALKDVSVTINRG